MKIFLITLIGAVALIELTSAGSREWKLSKALNGNRYATHIDEERSHNNLATTRGRDAGRSSGLSHRRSVDQIAGRSEELDKLEDVDKIPTVSLVDSHLTEVSMQWELFKTKYGKEYSSVDEERQRHANFRRTMQKIVGHNSKGSDSYQLKLNRRSDWSAEEWERMMGLRADLVGSSETRKNVVKTSEFLRDLRRQDSGSAPDQIDWRQTPGIVSEIKDQGGCGSCWAFATTGVLEGQQLKQTNGSKLVPISEQDLIDCSKSNNGCYGGFMKDALDDVAKMGGIESEVDYKYIFAEGECAFRKSRSVMTDAGHLMLTNITETELAETVAKFGPVSVGIYASPNLFFYAGGVYSDSLGSDEKPNHGVLIVGYGTDPKEGPYWIIKNSWGKDWGEAGYFRLLRGTNECKVLAMPTIPKF